MRYRRCRCGLRGARLSVRRLEPERLGRLSFPDLPSRQGSLRPQRDLCAWRRTVGHEGGLEHVGDLRRIGGGRDREVSIPTLRRDNGLVKTNRSRGRSPRASASSVARGLPRPRHPHQSADVATRTRAIASRPRRVRAEDRCTHGRRGHGRARSRPQASMPAARSAAASSSYSTGGAATSNSLFSRPPYGPPTRAPASRAMSAPAAWSHALSPCS